MSLIRCRVVRLSGIRCRVVKLSLVRCGVASSALSDAALSDRGQSPCQMRRYQSACKLVVRCGVVSGRCGAVKLRRCQMRVSSSVVRCGVSDRRCQSQPCQMRRCQMQGYLHQGLDWTYQSLPLVLIWLVLARLVLFWGEDLQPL